jgi:hypothetical protein
MGKGSWSLEGLGLGWVCELGTGTDNGKGKGCRVGDASLSWTRNGKFWNWNRVVVLVGDHLRFGLKMELELEC